MEITKPLLRGHLHQAMFFVSIGACSLLIAKSSGSTQKLASIIYSVSVMLLFGISALYHRVNWSVKARALMKKLDHSAIYIMIAGTCTPITLLTLSNESGMTLLLSIWGVALLGIIQSIFFVNIPKLVSALIYLIPGYMITFYTSELIPKLGTANIVLMFVGGAFYTFGAISYGIKRPALNPKVFGYHELFHACVNVGATIHFIMIYSVIS